MKKRALTWIVCIFMLFITSAGANEMIPGLSWYNTPEATPVPAFSFRNGVTWNMTREQVRGVEIAELTERTKDQWSILQSVGKVNVSRYTADLVYMFYNDRLKMITYDFGSEGSQADYRYLTGALDKVYGEHTEPDANAVVSIMDMIYPGMFQTERMREVKAWSNSADTWIYLYYYSDRAYGILYVNATEAPTAEYDTNGL